MKGEAEAFLSPPSPIRVIAGVWVVVVAVDFAASVAVTCSAFDVAFVCFSLVAVISVVAPAETPRAAPAVVDSVVFEGARPAIGKREDLSSSASSSPTSRHRCCPFQSLLLLLLLPLVMLSVVAVLLYSSQSTPLTCAPRHHMTSRGAVAFHHSII